MDKALYHCRERVNSRGRLDRRRGYKECGYQFEGMTPTNVRAATGRSVTCPQCGGIPSLINVITEEVEKKAIRSAKAKAAR